MKRLAVVIAVLVSGCAVDEGSSEPVEQSAGACPYMPEHPGFCAPLGSTCDAGETPFCDRGLGWCSVSVCRPFCSPITWPHCSSGQAERLERDAGGAAVCVCIPE